MTNYDFTTLSPADFEVLVRDLLQCHFNVHIESFKSGRDAGIDLRYARFPSSPKIVIQCKHYSRSKLSNLKSKLKKEELSKIKKLNPERYILVTSLSLTPKNKDVLKRMLDPFCIDDADIIHAGDLNNFLGKYPEIEKKHYKLWFSSTAILQRLLHNDVFTESYWQEEEIKRRLSLYVPTPAVERVMDSLEQNGYCLISGIPGIGKTTTAEIVVAHYLKNRWNCVSMTTKAEEARKVYDPKTHQLFYWDDFLGQTSLEEKLDKNEDRTLLNMIRDCSHHKKSKRLILTTREYILEQAKQQHETLSRANMDYGKCVVEVKDYTDKIRAEILVNHLFFYDVPQSTCAYLVDSGTALKIIEHKNYFPRLIETMCTSPNVQSKDSEEFAAQFITMLDNPNDIWQHAFDNQLSEDARTLFLCTLSNEQYLKTDCLEQIFNCFKDESDSSNTRHNLAFKKAAAELEGSFLQFAANIDMAITSYINPSLKDFSNSLIRENPSLANFILKKAIFFEQIQYVLDEYNAPEEITDDTVFSAIERTYRVPGSGVYSFPFFGRLPNRKLDISNRLNMCLKWLSKRGDILRSQFTSLIFKFLSEASHPVDFDSLMRIYEFAYNSSKQDGVSPPIEPDEIVDAVLELAERPEDFYSISSFVETISFDMALFDDDRYRGWEQATLVTIRSKFVEFCRQELSDNLDSYSSVDELDILLSDIEEFAKLLDVNEEFDTTQANEHRTELESDLEDDDELPVDKYKPRTINDRVEQLSAPSVSDILGSLKQ